VTDLKLRFDTLL